MAEVGYVEETTLGEMFLKRNGRLNRWRYFKRRVVLGIAITMLLTLGYRIFGYEFGQVNTPYAGIYNTVLSLLFVIPTYCLNVRRLQDMNRGKIIALVYAAISVAMAFMDFTGVNYQLYLALTLATMSFAISGYLLIAPGTLGKNRYGLSPIPIK